MPNNTSHKSTKSNLPPSNWVETPLGFIPKDWKIIPANEFCEKVTDGTHDSPKQSQDGKLLVTSKNLKNGQLDISSAYLISIEDFDEVNRRSKVDKWDILLSMIGTVGEVCLISNEPDFAIKNVGLFKCRNESNAKWLYYFLRSNIGQNHILSRLSGTTQKYITLRELRNFPIIVPTNEVEQKAITSVLSVFDDKIELLREQNKILEELGQTIFKEWFGKYRVDDELPDGWKIYSLGEVSKMTAGGDKPKNSTAHKTKKNIVPIYSNGISNDGLYGYTDSAKIYEESVTISARGTIGYVSLRQEPYVPIVRLVAIIPNKQYLSSKYLFLWLKNQNIAGTGTTQQQLTIPDFSRTRITIPDQGIMFRFTALLNDMYKKISHNNSQIQSLAHSRDELLSKLMSGQFRVSF